jgi:UDP-N-acetylmuramate dehydrogenase
MEVQEARSLRDLTTLRLGGPVRFTIPIVSAETIPEALAFARERNLPVVVMGEGSNVLPPDEGYEGVILLMRIPGIVFTDVGDSTLVSAGAGVSWDALVGAATDRGLWGLENLAGIPGTVGAAPVQNIGAYGAEARHVVDEVTVYDADTGKTEVIPVSACGFAYRDSRFKHESNLIIINVVFRLARTGAPNVSYPDLIRLAERGVDLSTPSMIAEAVRGVRSAKFPDLAAYGTAGSFFKNPIVGEETYQKLSLMFEREAAPYGGIPTYPVAGQVKPVREQRTGTSEARGEFSNGLKIPLAFILDKFLGMRGYRKGDAFLFGNQPLVLVADKGARARDIDALAQEIETRVRESTGIEIEREVQWLAFHEHRS